MRGAMRAAMAFAFTFAIAVISPSIAVAQTTGLTGEVFEGTYVVTQPCEFDPDTSTYSFSYEAAGTAIGPYAGTYTEEGTVTFGAAGVGVLVSKIEATFKIYVAGQLVVTGTKSSLDPTVPLTGTGTCTVAAPGVPAESSLAFAVVSYTAAITDPNTGVTTNDRGAASFGLVLGVHNEFFASLGTAQEVRPGLGCGDKNHVHEREEVCKKISR